MLPNRGKRGNNKLILQYRSETYCKGYYMILLGFVAFLSVVKAKWQSLSHFFQFIGFFFQRECALRFFRRYISLFLVF